MMPPTPAISIAHQGCLSLPEILRDLGSFYQERENKIIILIIIMMLMMTMMMITIIFYNNRQSSWKPQRSGQLLFTQKFGFGGS